LARQGGPGSQTLTGSSPQFLAPGCLIWWPAGSIGGNQFLRYQWVQTCWFLWGWINNLWESELIRTNTGLLTMTSKNRSFNLETEQHKQEEGDNWWTTSQRFFAGVNGIGNPEVLQKSNSCTSFQALGENNLDLGGIHPPAANIIWKVTVAREILAANSRVKQNQNTPYRKKPSTSTNTDTRIAYTCKCLRQWSGKIVWNN
jgi:hypothetical protein